MIEKRCPKCNHLLYKYADNPTIEIKCNKCKSLFTFASVDLKGLKLEELSATVVESKLEGITQAERFDSLKQIISDEYYIEKVLNLQTIQSHDTIDMLYMCRFIGYKK